LIYLTISLSFSFSFIFDGPSTFLLSSAFASYTGSDISPRRLPLELDSKLITSVDSIELQGASISCLQLAYSSIWSCFTPSKQTLQPHISIPDNPPSSLLYAECIIESMLSWKLSGIWRSFSGTGYRLAFLILSIVAKSLRMGPFASLSGCQRFRESLYLVYVRLKLYFRLSFFL